MSHEALVIWSVAGLFSLAVFVPYGVRFRSRRRRDRQRYEEARQAGSGEMGLQYPYIDASRCIGCATCVRACPEDVLGVVGGTAVVINALRCIGHARCEDACPVGAIEVGMGDVKGRTDLPLLDQHLETSVPGVFVAGELSGLALISRAVSQGMTVVERIAERLAAGTAAGAPRADGVFDLVIVGAGPAGIAAALAARRRGLTHVVLEQEPGLGGSLLHFPRRKLVLTQPVELVSGVRLDREQYTKEELLAFFERLLDRHDLQVRFGERVAEIQSHGGELRVVAANAIFRARHVVLALGRRGTPRRLGVPGEAMDKVMYQLRDAENYRDQRVLVVGGGDSAVEAAIGLARQRGNRVTVSYRRDGFVRIKKKNQDTAMRLAGSGRLELLFGSEVESISEGAVVIRTGAERRSLGNDAVFVLIGGDPPFPMLEKAGIRFGGEPRDVVREKRNS